VKLAFDGEREWMAPPLHFRVGERPLWLVTPETLVRDGTERTELTAVEPRAEASDVAPVPAGGLLPA
jgi:hypothetical protein